MLGSAGTLGKDTAQPFSIIKTADGQVTLIDCDSVAAIARYMVHEDNTNMTRADMKLFQDLVSWSDGAIADRHDLIALDSMMVQMVITGQPCSILKGGNSA